MATFCELLEKAIKDEVEAPKDYEKLLSSRKLALPEHFLINSIINDERSHAKILDFINKELCK